MKQSEYRARLESLEMRVRALEDSPAFKVHVAKQPALVKIPQIPGVTTPDPKKFPPPPKVFP